MNIDIGQKNWRMKTHSLTHSLTSIIAENREDFYYQKTIGLCKTDFRMG